MAEVRNAPGASSKPVDPASRICAKHKLRVAPDGLCALCRRGASAQESSTGSHLATWVLGLLMLGTIGVVLYWMIAPGERPGGTPPPVTQGPPLDDQIKAVDDQIDELQRARVAGELGPGGLQRLSQLEIKRKLLAAARDAARD